MSRSIIVTGSTGNLGLSVTDKLKKEGYRVLATSTSERGVNSLKEKGIDGFKVDLSNEASVGQFIDQIHHWKPSAVVLLAGGFAIDGIEKMTLSELQPMINLNFTTAQLLIKGLLPILEENGGQIFLIGAKPALEPELGHQMAAYAISKGMLFQLSSLINAYGKEKNIRSTVLVPGVIDTAANREAMPDADRSSWTSPSTIAETILSILKGEQRDSVIKFYEE